MKYRFLIILFIVAISQSLLAQTGYVDIKGKIKDGSKSISTVKIEVYESNILKESVNSESSGRFNLKLEFDKKYIIQFSKNSYVSKKVEFDTHVDEKQYVWPYPFTIELFETIDGLDVSALNAPVTKIYYSKNEGDFIFDIPYTNGMKAKIAQIQIEIDAFKRQAYTNKIGEADKKYREKKFDQAIDLYEEAITINPFTDYPDKQIMLCEKRLAGSDGDQRIYDKNIASADQYFNDKRYELAKSDYKKAQKVFPDKAHPKNRIIEIDALLADGENQAQRDKYASIIKKADEFFSKEDYLNAKNGYNAALAVLPTETYPKEKIAEIESLKTGQARLAGLNKQYDNKISEANQLFSKKDYEASKKAYLFASKIKPDEQYPKDRIQAIDSELNLLAQKDAAAKDYLEKIKEADQTLGIKDYKLAKKLYLSAINLNSNEDYPKNKIKEIDGIVEELAQKSADEEKYQSLIKNADAFLASKQYSTAQKSYLSALDLKPNEQYPKGKLNEIKNELALIADKNSQEQNYQEALKDANSAFGNKAYENAKTYYTTASSIKPSEAYPKERLAEINIILTELANKASKAKEYENLISLGDQKFNSKDYNEAKITFQSALLIQPTSDYPKTKLKEIEVQLGLIAQSAENEKAYGDHLKTADAAFSKKDYEAAKLSYISANSVKPDEGYPKERLNTIDGILADLSNQKEKDEQYQKMVQLADANLGSKNYEAAKSNYKSALNFKPSESYPKEKLKEIESIEAQIAQNKVKDEDYAKIIAQADKKFDKKDYQSAKSTYNSALSLKPTEAYPKDRISEINTILDQQTANKAKDELYNKKMADAEAKFEAKKYLAAKLGYEEALKVKPNQTYPENRIVEIDGLLKQLADQKTLDTEYKTLISSADTDFAKKDYETSKKNYSSALRLKPNENYPNQRIRTIDDLLLADQNQKAIEEQYNNIVSNADAQFNQKAYQDAKLTYNSALEVKPNEQYPRTKIREIDKALGLIAAETARLKAIEDDYQAKLDEGQRLLDKMEYQLAKQSYKSASLMKPDQDFPEKKIAEIDVLLAQMGKDTQYAAALKEGSDYQLQRKYSDAKLAYQAALDIKPNESFPKKKIEELDGLVAKEEKAQLIKAYKKLMELADKKFTIKDYANSKHFYEQALVVNATAQYPKDRIKEIDKLLLLAENKAQADMDKKQEYVSLIQSADGFFTEKNYGQAKVNYKKALKISPTESYPKSKIRELEKLIASEVEIPEEINFSNEAEKNKFMSTMAKKYGEGIHEENYSSKSGKIVRRIIVVKRGIADEYREVKQPWGATYFFKNGKSVSRAILYKETKE